LDAARVEFNIGADDMADIKRFPSTVVDLPTLVSHLRALKAELENPKPDTVSSGKKKSYKMIVLALHALGSWVTSSVDADWNLSAPDLAKAVVRRAATREPPGLSSAAAILWTKTFAGDSPRLHALMLLLIHFGNHARRPAVAGGAPDTAGRAAVAVGVGTSS
jgi:hypothetical protein